MRKLFACAVLAAGLIGCGQNKEKGSIKLNTDEDKVSYAIGMDVAKNFKRAKMDTILNPEAFYKGLIDGMDTTIKAQMTKEEASKMLEDYFRKKAEDQKKAELQKFEKNKLAGEKFLAENKKNPDVQTTASGLQYTIVTKGTGPMPKLTDVVKVHYIGKLIDGTEFDNSVKRGEPATFPLTQVIPGWTEVLQLMPVGSKFRAYIPQNIAYGENQMQGSPIEPYSTLVFEIELLEILDQAAVQAAQAEAQAQAQMRAQMQQQMQQR